MSNANTFTNTARAKAPAVEPASQAKASQPVSATQAASVARLAVAARPARSHHWARTGRQMLVGLLFLLPALLFYITFELWPIIQTFWYSLYRWNGIDASTYVGFSNYKEVFTDPELYGSIIHSFFLIIFFSIVPIAIALITAVLVKDLESKTARGIAQVFLFLPRVIPGAAAGVAWTWMLADNGTVNQMLKAVGLEPHQSVAGR